MLANVPNAQLGIPEKRVDCTLEYLALVGKRFERSFERRAAIGAAEYPGADFADHQLDIASDRPNVLEALRPQKTSVVSAARI